MTAWVLLVAASLVVTKVLDVATTLARIRAPWEETNPLARQLMGRVGVTLGALAVLGVTLFIIAVATLIALRGGILAQVFFLLAGTAVAAVQAAVAVANWTGRDNPVTRVVRGLHVRISDGVRILAGRNRRADRFS